MSNTKVFGPTQSPEPDITSTRFWAVVSAPGFMAFAAAAISFPFWFFPVTALYLRTYVGSSSGVALWSLIALLVAVAIVSICGDVVKAKSKAEGPARTPRNFGFALLAVLLIMPGLAANRVYHVIPENQMVPGKGCMQHFPESRERGLDILLWSIDAIHSFEPIKYRLFKGVEPPIVCN